MSKKTGLGKGLDALFGANIEEQIENVTEGEIKEIVKEIKIIEIEPNKNQPRRSFDEEALAELAESIKRYGVLQPIIVSKKDNYYEIIAGERRWRASKIAGLKTIPAIIKEEVDEQANKEIALIENIQREDLNPIEKSRAIKTLMVEHNLTQQQAADILGMARSAIANSVRLLNLDPRVIDLALEGKLSEGHCKSLLSIDDLDTQYEIALYVVESGASVREAEKKMSLRKKGVKRTKDYDKYDAIYRDIESDFRDFFGTKVRLQPKERSGKIVISYSSADELSRIVDIIKQNQNNTI